MVQGLLLTEVPSKNLSSSFVYEVIRLGKLAFKNDMSKLTLHDSNTNNHNHAHFL